MPISSALGSSALLPAGLGFRNVIINGAMQIAQRATSAAGLTSGETYRTVDRFVSAFGTTGTWTETQSTDAPPGFGNSRKFECTTANASLSAGSYLIWGQNIEGQNLQQFAKGTASAKPFMLSFWVKAFQTGTFVAELYDNTNSRQVTKTFTINASATWEYKTIQFPADATGAFANSNANALSLFFWLVGGTTFTSGTATGSWSSASNGNRAAGLSVNGASSTSNYFQFTGLQLEQNYQPTPFEQRPIGTELALCQRYYEKSYLNEVAVGTNTTFGLAVITGSTDANGYIYASIPMKVSKRISAPQSQSSSNSVFKLYTNTGTADQVFYYRNGANGVATTTCGTNNVGQDNISIYVYTGAAAWVPAYLVFHWVYNAEL
jgi:hypothetical protein